MRQEKLVKKFDRQVAKYESNRDNQAIAVWRERLISDAYGKVLEAGVGAGANFSHYDRKKVIEITGVDMSKEMIKSAEREAFKWGLNVEFIHQDIDNIILDYHLYDSIVSTLTLCSYLNPVRTLNKFNDSCKKDGRLLFLEHGLSSNTLLSFSQKVLDPLYIRISGCHCNRDMLSIFEQSKLHIEHIERHWSGTISLIWAKPSHS